ncbi:MAG TPA: T9SS type A sorting domain-containing protein [Salinimicrobium sp.]|nr:T9SS type A sorting domain-containing protein [Salinimicrobium sp.]
MKKTILLLFLFISGSLFSQYATEAPWMLDAKEAKTTNSIPSFNEVVTAFNNYWEDKNPNVKGSGYKPFMRWQQHWKNYLKPDGTLLTPQEIWGLWEQKQAFANETEDDGNWQSVGPNTHTNTGSWSSGQGRINAIEIDPNNSNIFYVGAPAGGIWKSTDAGSTWEPLSDYLPQIGVSAIAVDPSNSNTIYLGTGDEDAGDTYSIGVLKSTDGGETWETTGLVFGSGYSYVSEIYVNPNNTDVVLVSTSDGMYKSTNAGVSFSMVKSGSFRDIKVHPGNSSIIYAVTSNNFFKSTDAGDTFTLINSGLPFVAGRQVLAVTPAAPNNVYILSASTGYAFQGVFKSTDSGNTFSRVDNGQDIFESTQAWYDMAFDVSNTDENIMYVGVLNVWKSTNGGASFTVWNSWSSPFGSTYTHADIHMIRFFGDDLFFGTDGGIYKSTDGNSTTDLTAGLAIGQFYRIAVAKQSSDNMVGGLQDNGGFGYSDNQWKNFYGADGMDTAIDPDNPDMYYGFIQNGSSLYFSSTAGDSNSGAVSGPESGNWITPLIMNKEGELYAGYSRLYKLEGNSFSIVSSSFSNLIDGIEIDPINSDNMYVFVDDKLHKSVNRGVSFVQAYDFPSDITSVAVNSTDPNIIYVTTSGSFGGIYKSTNAGTSFTDISYNLPNEPKLVVKHQGQHSLNPIFVGTILGVYRLDDSVNEWAVFGNNLPNVPVRDLEINLLDQNITAATYGRGIWRSSIPIDTPDHDVRLLQIDVPEVDINCESFSPEIIVNNNGLNPITSFEIAYSIDGGTAETIEWEGTLAAGETTTVAIPQIIASRGAHELEINLSMINDAFQENNEGSKNFYLNDAGTVGWINTFENASDALIVVDANEENPTWERGTPSGMFLNDTSSGENAYATKLNGNYPNNTTSYLVSQCYDLTNITNPVVEFNMAFKLEFEWDIVYMEYSTNGSDWEILGSFNDPNWYNNNEVPGEDCHNCPGAQWTGPSLTMQPYSYSLEDFTSETSFMVRFVFRSDEAVNDEGVVVDDFVIQGGSMGVENAALENAFAIYPNPSKDIFNIDLSKNLESVDIRLMDLTGKEILSVKDISDNYKIDLSGFAASIYLLQVQTENAVIVKKLIKQ